MSDVSGESKLRTRLGWRAERRPAPGFAYVLGAGAGAFAVFAVVAFVVEIGGDDPTAAGVLLDLALAVLAFVLGLRVVGPLRSAATTVLVLTVPVIWVFALLGDGTGGRGSVRVVYILTLVAYVALYLAGWTRGRAVLLAGALLVFSFWIAFEVAGDSGSALPFQDQVSTPFSADGSSGGSQTFTVTSANENSDSAATITFVIGLVMLGVGAALDQRKLAGAATPFIAVGAIDAILGAAVLGGNDSAAAGGVLAALTGVAVGYVGSRGENRRGAVWIGGLTIVIGLVVTVADAAGDSAGGFAGLALVVAAVLGFAGWFLAPRLGETDDGGPNGTPALAAGPVTAELPRPAHRARFLPRPPTTRRPRRTRTNRRRAREDRPQRERRARQSSRATTAAIISPASVGFCATCTPASRKASIFAAAVPLPPDTIAPAWPIFLPGGAVTPAT